jgi:hypothetical protein
MASAGPDYAVQGLVARHPATGLTARFTEDGVEVAASAAPAARVHFRLAGVGREGDLRPVAAARPEVEGNRVTYRRGGGLTEWYLYGPPGLEQGFTLEQRPAGEGELVVEVELGGELNPRLLPGGQAIELVDGAGEPRLRYTDLFARDATGAPLPCRMELRDRQARLVVDDAGARYPIEVDPLTWAGQWRLLPSDGRSDIDFGHAVAVDGDTLVVGAPGQPGYPATPGSVHVFVRTGSTWTLQARLLSPGANTTEGFGSSLALEGNTLAIGAPGLVYDAYNNKVYVFTRSGSTWSQQQQLEAADPVGGDSFGVSLALDSDTLVIGASGVDTALYDDAGAAYIFTRTAGVWAQSQKLVNHMPYDDARLGASAALDGNYLALGAPGYTGIGRVHVYYRSSGTWSYQRNLTGQPFAAEDSFGRSVSLAGDTLVVGATGDDELGDRSGAAYIFVRSGTTWPLQAKLHAADAAAEDALGSSVVFEADTLVVGAPGADFPGSSESGAAYVFTRSGVTWSQQQKLTSTTTHMNSYLGHAVALSADTAVLGAPGESEYRGHDGAAHVFVRAAGVWSEERKLTAVDNEVDDHFGAAVAISGDTAIVGVPGDDARGADSGSAQVFVYDGSAWSRQQVLLAADGAAGDAFGAAVAISGDTIVVGAHGSDALASLSGSAYVFVRTGAVWTQQQKLTASDGAAYDHFGWSVAIDGDTILVGAMYEGAPTNSGSAYVFVRAGSTWSEQRKLVASDPTANDYFGVSVALDENTAVVGAHHDDDLGENSGSAYVFVRAGTAWSQQQKLMAPDGAVSDNFGASVAISGATLVAGAPQDDDLGENSGSAHVFVRTGSTWSQQQKLIAADGAAGDRFGSAVAIDGDVLVIGSPTDDDTGTNSGSAYFFGRVAGAWTQDFKLAKPNGTGGEIYGEVVALSGDLALLGAPNEDACDLANSGAAYLIRLRLTNGSHCPGDLECSTGYCVDGVCCNQACGDGALDCRACSVAAGAAVDGTCGPLTAAVAPTVTCRAATDLCDAAETCSSASTTCPADSLQPPTFECRAAAGSCDRAESCTGTSAECPADAFLPPFTECRASAGVCDRAEVCTGDRPQCPIDSFQPAGTTCRPAACESGVETDPGTCTGAGADCPAETTSPCAPFVCGPDACLAACAGPADCLPGNRCEAGMCLSNGAQGDACLAAAECLSGFCADGYCCDGACAGQCEACDLPGVEGACGPVEGAPHGERTACTSDGSACGGACDGSEPSACAYPGAEVPCREASCTDAVAVLAAACQGTGACPAEQTQACAPAECDGDRCGGGCVLDTDCQAGQYCAAGVCVGKLAQGESCAGDLQCQNGLCVDGFCCDGTCDGQCEACDLADSEGACVPVTGAPHGGRAACAGQGACQGSCDGQAPEACAFPAAGTACSASACLEGLFTPAGVCDGAGSCSVSSQQPCAPYVCGDGACLTACEDDQNCASGYECVGDACQLASTNSGCGCSTRGDRAGDGGLLAAALLGLALYGRRRR